MSRSAPGGIVVGATAADAVVLGDGHLHVIDVAPVPDRLEDAVGEAQRQDVLHRLLAQVMVDAIDLRFAESDHQVVVQRPCALDVVAERLLDDQAAPAVALAGQPRVGEVSSDHAKEVGRRRQIEQVVRWQSVCLASRGEYALQTRVQRLVSELAGDIVKAVFNVLTISPRRAARSRPSAPVHASVPGRRCRPCRDGRRR